MASRTGWNPLALLACSLAPLGVCGALAEPAAAAGPEVSAEVRRVAGTDTTLADSGLYRVDPERGRALLTHGPDPPPPLEPGSPLEREMPAGVGFAPGDAERPPLCASTDAQRILYARPAGAPDALASARPAIQDVIRRMNAVLNEESLESGGPTADYRVRCTTVGETSVDGFASAGSSFSQIVTAARAAGFDSQLVDYTIFFDGEAGGSCGIASYADDETLSADNLSNFGGGYAVVYKSCWYGETPMHESGHTMGAVQYGAPNSTGSGGHCYEEMDVMCYSPDGGSVHQEGPAYKCDGTPRFDCGFDDYFDSAPEPGEYLESHWNLGSPLNAFISFGGAGPSPAPPAVAKSWRTRAIRVPRQTSSLRVSVRASKGERLYLNHRREPTQHSFSCRDWARRGRAACRIRNPLPGRWFVGVLRPANPSSKPLRIEKRIVAAPDRTP